MLLVLYVNTVPVYVIIFASVLCCLANIYTA